MTRSPDTIDTTDDDDAAEERHIQGTQILLLIF